MKPCEKKDFECKDNDYIIFRATKHLLANTLTCYALMHISPAQYIHK